MAIRWSVGTKGRNDLADVKVVQAALNLSHSVKFKHQRLLVDGKAGARTAAAIEQFQRDIVGLSRPDGRVDPGGKTLRSLKAHTRKGLSEDALLAIMALGKRQTINTYLPLMKVAFPKYRIIAPLRMAHFFAQVGHESMSFVYTEELASGAAYEGRIDLGNTQKGDGVRFKGRGLIQLTGRTNYTQYSQYVGVDFTKQGNETLIATRPKYALDVSLWFWDHRRLNSYADSDNLRAITRRVNGGYNGLPDRQNYLTRAKFFLVK